MAETLDLNRATKITDVAEALGVSVATVSRALTKPQLLRRETRERVLDAVERLGYRPNLLARDLRLKATRTAYVVVPSLSPFFLEVFRGVERAARSIGYTVLMGHTDRDPEREQVFFDQVAAGRADGVILVSSTRSPDTARRNTRLPPVVAALEQIEDKPFPAVRVDHTAAGAAATQHLRDLGHRHIAHISGPLNIPMAVRRVDGYRQVMGADYRAELCVEGAFTVDSGEEAMADLLQMTPRPTAVFAANDQMAVGAVRAVRKAGLRVPEDISVIGFDDQQIATICEPPLTTVRIPTAEIGCRAMMMLGGLLGGALPEQDVVLPTEVIVRGTTAILQMVSLLVS